MTDDGTRCLFAIARRVNSRDQTFNMHDVASRVQTAGECVALGKATKGTHRWMPLAPKFRFLMEARGIEPRSEAESTTGTTCVSP